MRQPGKQKQVLEFIQREVAFGGFPTSRRIAEHMGWASTSSARECLDRLVLAGRLTRTKVARPTLGRRLPYCYRYELPE